MDVLLSIKIHDKIDDKSIRQLSKYLQEVDNCLFPDEMTCFELVTNDKYHIHLVIEKDKLLIVKEDMR